MYGHNEPLWRGHVQRILLHFLNKSRFIFTFWTFRFFSCKKKNIYINSHCQCWIIFTCERINVIYQFEGCVCSAAGSHFIVAFIQELSQTCWIEINLSHAGMEAYLRQKKRKKCEKFKHDKTKITQR